MCEQQVWLCRSLLSRRTLGKKMNEEMEWNQPFNEPKTNSWVDQLQNIFVELPIPIRQIHSQSVQFSSDLLDCNFRGPIMYVYWLFWGNYMFWGYIFTLFPLLSVHKIDLCKQSSMTWFYSNQSILMSTSYDPKDKMFIFIL